jgi:hypothetical protein
MPAPYSQDLRDRVASTVSGGSSARSTAKRFGIGISTVVRSAQCQRAEEHAEARAHGRRSSLTSDTNGAGRFSLHKLKCPLGKGHFAVMEASSRVTDAKTIVAADPVIIVS